MSEPKRVNIYTDGACINNPGPGGYHVILDYESRKKEKSGGFRRTTSNRMEIMAAIVGLESLKGKCRVIIFTDSQYLVKAIMEGWAKRWQARGWMRNKKEKALNSDLWQKVLKLCEEHEVELRWVRGHDAHPENERCDHLANEAANRANLPIDEGYENLQKHMF